MIWDCPIILKYWKDTKQILEKIMKVVIPLKFETVCLGLMPDTVKGPENKYLHNILSLASKKSYHKELVVKEISNRLRFLLRLFKMSLK